MAVYEDHTDYTIRAWLQEPVHLPEEGRATVAQRIRETPQQRHWWPSLPSRRSPSMLPAVKFVVASVFLAVFGGLVLGGFMTMPSDNGSAPGAVMTPAAMEGASPSPAAKTELPADVAVQVEALEAGLPEDWALPLVVRDVIAEGRFEAAPALLTQATSVLENLVEVNRLLPEVDLMPIVQPQFENAENGEELDAVTDWVEWLLDGAVQVVSPLGELSDALPPGWTFPVAVNAALADQRFDDVPVAVEAATDTVSALVRADAEVPDEGVLDSYRDRFENAASVEALEALAAQVSDPGTGSPSPAPMASEPGSQPSAVTEGQAAAVDWPRNEKTYLVIEQPSATMVQGQTQRLTAKWCRDEDCRPANDIEWRVDTKQVLKVNPKSGPWTDVKAKSPGVGFLEVGERGNLQSPTIWVYPKPGVSDVPAAVTPRRVEVAYPNELVVKPGQHFVLTGWRCPTRDAEQLGRDAVPGTADDECRTREISDVSGFMDSGLALVGMVGPSAVLKAEQFISLDYALVADPVRLSFADRQGAERRRPMAVGTSHVYVRDAERDGPPLGDLNADGQVAEADIEVLAIALGEYGPRITAGSPGWQAELDLNSDGRVDEVDEGIVGVLTESYAGEIEPVRLDWYMTKLR